MYLQLIWFFKRILSWFGCIDKNPILVQVDYDGDGETDVEFRIN